MPSFKGRWSRSLIIALSLVASLTLAFAFAPRSEIRTVDGAPKKVLKPISQTAVSFGETRPLSEIAKRQPRRRGISEESEEREAAENRAVRHPTLEALASASQAGGLVKDEALQAFLEGPNAMPAPILTFEGLGSTDNTGSLSPPDPNGAVGPNHYVQQDNLRVRIWNKTGTPLTPAFFLSTLFTVANGGPGGQCAAADQGDPIVLYDQLADRWIISQFGFSGSGTAPPFFQCIAISKTADPTGAYYAYGFQTPGAEFPDYPKMGVWTDGYYMTVNQFTEPGDVFNGTGVYSFNRAKMLAGDPTANYVYFSLNTTSFPEQIGGMLPSTLDGLTPPPAGRPNTFAYFTASDFGDPANGLRLFDFHADFATPANSTFAERAESTYNSPLPVAAFSVTTPTTNNGRSVIPQPGGSSTTGLDAITDRLLFRMQYRNFGSYETLVMNHTVGAPASTTYGTFRAAPRYYELRKTGAAPFTIQEQATFAPADGVSRWMGSAAEDNQGNLAVAYNVSDGTSVFPGIRYAGRLAGDAPGGLQQGEATLVNGAGRQTSTGNRWGDYSSLTLDPTDDCTFWYTSEYYQTTSSVGWQTRIGSFKFPGCTAPQKGTAHFAVTNCSSAAAIAGAVVTIDGITYGASIAGGTYDGSLAPGNHTYTVARTGYGPVNGNFSITNGNTTNVPVCLTGVPLINPAGAAVTADPNSNGAIDPGETVTVNFTLRNDGTADTTNLVATLQPTGGVQSPSAPQTYGVVTQGGGTGTKAFTFTASNALACGSTLTATLQLQDGASSLGTAAFTFTVCPKVVVTATAGVTGPTSYDTLKAAFDAINAGTHQGAITVSLAGSTTETASAVLNGGSATPANYTSVVIRPTSDGVTVSGASATGRGLIELNGASNVTLDGDNPNTAGTNRNLTLQNTATNTTAFTSVVRLALATTGTTTGNSVTVRNLAILGNATGRNVSGASSTTGSENTTYGVYAGSGGGTTATTAPSAVTSVSATIANPATASNFVVQNNSINDVGRGVAIMGAATSVFPGLQVVGNNIGNSTAAAADQVYVSAVLVNGTSDGLVSGNTVYVEGFVASSTSGANQAISIGAISANTTATIEKNRVARVRNNATDTWPAVGINLAGGNNHVVQNNFVTDITNNQVAGSGGGGTTFGAYGIRAVSGTGHKVYHNSVHMTGTIPGTLSTNLTAAFIIVNTTQTGMDVRNNIFSNLVTGGNPTTTNVRHAVIFLPSGATSSMNLTLNNNAYVQGPATTGALSLLAKVGTAAGTGEYLAANFAAGATTPATNLRAYTSTLSAAGTNDNASFATLTPQFTSNTDLHIPAGTQGALESGGAAVGLTTDIDGQVRPGPAGSINGGGTAPDIGADEFDGKLPAAIPPNDISAGGFVSPPNGATVTAGTPFTVQASFTNSGSAAQTNVPVRFRIRDNTNTVVYNQSVTIPTLSPGQTATATFPNATLPAGSYTTQANAELGGDTVAGNDSIAGTLTAQAPGACTAFSEGFDDITTLTAAGWVQKNQSTAVGTTGWFQGNDTVFPSQSGAVTSYIGANFNNTTGTSTISNWLILPQMNLADGNTFSFYTRTTTAGTTVFPDRLQVRMSINGASTNTGTTPTDVGDFTTLLLDINPTYTDSYPHGWTKYAVTINGLGTPQIGRLAFRYFVEGGGPTGNNSDYIGIDTVQFSCAPTAATVSLAGRVVSSNGAGLRGAKVTLSGNGLTQPITVLTNSFGYYNFDNVQSGRTYLVGVSAKNTVFATPTRVINVVDSMADVDFVASP